MLDRYYHNPDETACSSFRSGGYVSDGMIPGGQNNDIAMADLPPFLRVLLVTDGTVTKSLEAYYWEPVAVDTLDQRLIRAESPIGWLHVEEGEDILIREVHLRGENSNDIYVSAFSVIRPAIIPVDLRQNVLDQGLGVGVLICDSGLESYRELLEITADHNLEQHPDHETLHSVDYDMIHRTYRIIIGGEPGILITETFPWKLYRQSK